MPVAAAKTRLWLSQLLLQHTQNIHEATQHLQQAQLLLKQVPGCYALKCQVLSELGRSQRYLARPKLEIAAYERGLQMCISGQKFAERVHLHQWQAHFCQRLVDIHVAQGNLQDAQQTLNAALENAVHFQDLSTQVLLQLAQLQLHMLSQNTAATGQVVSSCTALLVKLAASQPQEPLCSQLHLHFCVLRALCLMSEGQYKELLKTEKERDEEREKTKGKEKLEEKKRVTEVDITPIISISELSWLLEQIGDREWEYTWLPTAAVHALVSCLIATIYRPKGKFKQALAYLSQAQQAIDEELEHQGIKGKESELPLQTVCHHHSLLFIKFLIIEGAAMVHMTQVELDRAQRDLTVLLQLCTDYPALLGKPLLSSLYMLAGNYALAVGDPSAAAERFVEAAQTGSSASQARLAAVSAALALLTTQHSDDTLKAADILRQYEVFDDIDSKLPFVEQGAGYFATGMVLVRQGQEKEGQLLLGKALRFAYNNLTNQQLVSQIILAMAPVQMQKGDTEGARHLLQSSLTLSSANHDVPTLVSGLHCMSNLHAKSGNMKDYHDCLKRAESKNMQYLQVIEGAQNEPSHSQIMQWQGFS
ncbi:hypothetical protein WJX77_011283 [Trebouxia sp. C0004]